VNGEVRQDDTTANLIFGFADLIAYITIFTTLKTRRHHRDRHAGRAGARFDPPRWLKPGDVVEVSVPELESCAMRSSTRVSGLQVLRSLEAFQIVMISPRRNRVRVKHKTFQCLGIYQNSAFLFACRPHMT
jgi:hypothetical protein